MAITILAPAPAVVGNYAESDSSDEDGGVDLEGDIDMRPKKRARHHGSSSIVTPGETVTDDPQWMRYTPFSLLNQFIGNV
jgi:exosome complex component RRP4